QTQLLVRRTRFLARFAACDKRLFSPQEAQGDVSQVRIGIADRGQGLPIAWIGSGGGFSRDAERHVESPKIAHDLSIFPSYRAVAGVGPELCLQLRGAGELGLDVASLVALAAVGVGPDDRAALRR